MARVKCLGAVIVLFAAAAAAGCPANCSLAGACQPDGRCLCDAPFTGTSCQQLEQLPASGVPAFAAPKGSTTWGGSAIQSDHNRSHFFMFASLSRNTTIDGYQASSVIVMTRSSSPAGPYSMVDQEAGPYTLGPREGGFWDGAWLQNPVVTRLTKSRGFLLFYAAGNQSSTHWAVGDSSIGVAFATELTGPWLRPSAPVLQPLPAPHWEDGGIANPAVFVDPHDDSILLAYRGTDDNGIAFASAPSWNGTYTRLFSGERIFVNDSLEDPYLMPGARGFHMLMHNIMGDCNWQEGCHCTIDQPPPGCNKRPGGQGPPHWVGAHAFGKVIVRSSSTRATGEGGMGVGGNSSLTAAEEKWAGLMTMQLARPGGYNLSVPTTSTARGAYHHHNQQQQEQVHFAHREEPKLLWLWSETRKEYVASHLFNVVEKGGPTALNWKYSDSWVHAQPLRLPADF